MALFATAALEIAIWKPTSTMKNKERSSFDFAFERQTEVPVVKWNDYSIVNVITKNSTIEYLAQARKEKKTASVPQPCITFKYNQNMGHFMT